MISFNHLNILSSIAEQKNLAPRMWFADLCINSLLQFRVEGTAIIPIV